MVVGEADDALDRLEVVGGAELGQEAGRRRSPRTARRRWRTTMSSSGSQAGPEPGPPKRARQAVDVEGEAGGGVAGVGMLRVGAEVEGDERLVEDQRLGVDRADRARSPARGTAPACVVSKVGQPAALRQPSVLKAVPGQGSLRRS